MEETICVKRLREEEDVIYNKKRKTTKETIKELWERLDKKKNRRIVVHGTDIRNYLLKDPILDYFKLNGSKKNDKEDLMLNELFKMGKIFEENIVSTIKNKALINGIGFIEMKNNQRKINENDALETIEYMKQGIPIIFQATLYNIKNNICGIADIIVRSDYINKFFDEPILTKEEEIIKASNLDGNYHYRVIDIKCSSLFLCSKSLNIRNSDHYPAYKGQLTIYNSSLGIMQGYIPNCAYILGNGWKRETCGIKSSSDNPFNLLGIIDYEGFDIDYIEKTINAIKWYRKIRTYHNKWKLNPPSVLELYPNMCNYLDAPYHEIKEQLAEQIKEITSIWKVGYENRQLAHACGIYKWTDPDCTSDILGMKTKTGDIVDKILEMNREKNDKIIISDKITNNEYEWKTKKILDFYVDFETIETRFINNEFTGGHKTDLNHSTIIFLIGVGYEENDEFKYKSYTVDKCEIENEIEIINQFMMFIDERRKNEERIRIFHWGHIERTMLLNYCSNKWNNILCFVDFIDVCSIFQKEPIIIKGMKNFGLKNVANAMYKNKLIKSYWNVTINDGLSAMYNAIQYYRNNESLKNKLIIEEIIKYNYFDCKIVYEIICYLRTL